MSLSSKLSHSLWFTGTVLLILLGAAPIANSYWYVGGGGGSAVVVGGQWPGYYGTFYYPGYYGYYPPCRPGCVYMGRRYGYGPYYPHYWHGQRLYYR